MEWGTPSPCGDGDRVPVSLTTHSPAELSNGQQSTQALLEKKRGTAAPRMARIKMASAIFMLMSPNGGLGRSKLVQELVVDAIEAAVAEHDDDVVFARLLFEPTDDRVRIDLEPARLPACRDGGGDLRRV